MESNPKKIHRIDLRLEFGIIYQVLQDIQIVRLNRIVKLEFKTRFHEKIGNV